MTGKSENEHDWIGSLQSGGDRRLTAARGDLAAAHLEGRVEAGEYAEGRDHLATAFTAPLRAEPSAGSPLLSELLFGERFVVYGQAAGWAWGQVVKDSYVGYVRLADLGPAPEPASGNVTCTVSAPLVHAFKEPDIKSPPLARFPMGARLSVKETKRSKSYRFLRIDGGGWVRSEGVFKPRKKEDFWPEGRDYVDLARAFLGAPYLWGGRTVLGIDCSGLIQNIFLCMLRDTDLQERQLSFRCQDVTEAGRRRGDIVFFPGHVGIMTDDTYMIHANATHMRVSIDPLYEVQKRIAKRHEKPLSAAYRFPGGTVL